MTNADDTNDRLRSALGAIRQLKAKLESLQQAQPSNEPTAIVGIGCRFPGGADSPAAFWDLLSHGVDATGEPSEDRVALWSRLGGRPAQGEKPMPLRGGYLREPIDTFDARFFRISPREAMSMDPQQRLLLELAWEALEDAGLPPSALRGTKTGVFVGLNNEDFSEYQLRSGNRSGLDDYTYTGSLFSVAAGRISYVFGLRGPNLAIDTACSSSLTAIHQACRSLAARECDAAIAGGVSLILSDAATAGLHRLGALSPDGRCWTFDARANGFARGEGGGLLVLRRLSDAIAAGDRILAVIAGSAVNHDGASAGLTAPHGVAQEEVIRAALKQGNVQPGDVGYVEAHGTGTVLGDPIEVDAIGAVLSRGRTTPLELGSVKANLGHLEAAAGVCGAIKVALALHHRELPPQVNLDRLNPGLHLESIPAEVPRAHRPWKAAPNVPRAAGISSFGISGTNAHAVLVEAPPVDPAKLADSDAIARSGAPQVLAVSAESAEALRAQAGRFAAMLAKPLPAGTTFRDVAFTSCARRAHLTHRLLVHATSALDGAEKLRAFAAGSVSALRGLVAHEAREQRRPLAFLFCGQGAQWFGMGRELFASEPVFKEQIEACARTMARHVSWSLVEELGRPEASSRLAETEIAQPAIFALQVALVALFASWGVTPSAVAGHSIGEIAAAHVAGALSFEEACRLACLRGRIMQKATGTGKMAAVPLSAAATEKLLAPLTGKVAVAAKNGPEQTVITGSNAALDEALALLQKSGIEAQLLRVNYAFHSELVAPHADELGRALATLATETPTLPFVSTLTGREETKLDARYWAEQMRRPVDFETAARTLLEGLRIDMFLEIGAHPVLAPGLDATASAIGRSVVLASGLRRGSPERETMFEALGTLHTRGYEVDFAKLYAVRGRVATLPSYPWQRERYWVTVTSPNRSAGSKWPFVQKHIESSDLPGKHVFECTLDLEDETFAYLADHQVQGSVWFPGAAFVELALEAADEAFGGAASLDAIAFARPLMLAPGEPVKLQLVLSPASGGLARFEITSRAPGEDAAWVSLASGALRLPSSPSSSSSPSPEEPARAPVGARGTELGAGDLYAGLAAGGLVYGPRFRGIEHLAKGADDARAKLVPPAKLAADSARYRLHPAVLDAAFQAAVAAAGSSGTTCVPASIGAVRISGDPAAAASCDVWITHRADDRVEADLAIRDGSGGIVAHVAGLCLKPLGAPVDRLDQNVFEIEWRAAETSATEDAKGPWLLFGDAGGLGDGIASRLRAAGERVVVATPGATFARQDPDRYTLDARRPEHVLELLRSAFEDTDPPRKIVHLGALDGAEGIADDVLDQAATSGFGGVLHLLQAVTQIAWSTPPRVVCLTRGAQPAPGRAVRSPAQALVWGLVASAVHEMPELAPTVVDLDDATSPNAIADLLTHLDAENRIAFRNDERFVARLVPHRRTRAVSTSHRKLTVGELGYRLEPERPGELDSLALRSVARTPPKPGEVEIEVRASGLNFRDVLVALGEGFAKGSFRTTGERLPIGSECAGVVTAVGEGVTSVAVGDEVVAWCLHGFDSHVHVRDLFVVHKPARLSFAEAAALPLVTATVHWALDRTARLEKGEKILIHLATGGVGLAAVQYAKHVGAEIYATAGSEAKRAYLRGLGIRHVYDSRTLAWADEVLRDTGGAGVDVILNALSGEAIPKGIAVLAKFGRFVEIGKKDVQANSALGLHGLRHNVSVSVVAVDQVYAERPPAAGKLLQDVFAALERGVFDKQPVESFPISQAARAFEHLARAKHIGKVVLTAEREVEVLEDERATTIAADRTYLVTGGLGGLGLVIAERLAAMGARHLALAGRSAPSDRTKIDALEASGVHVHVVQADVADRERLARSLDDLRKKAPPLAGIVHAAGVLEDATLLRMTLAESARVFAPKVRGAANLHQLTGDAKLDFFVTFSSSAAILGAPGQANYAAANAFLDAFAHWRAGNGDRTTSMAWGAWSEVGMASRADRAANIARQGLATLSPAEGAEIFERLLASAGPHVAPIPIDFRQWRQLNPQAAGLPLLRDVASASPARPGASAIRDEVAKAPAGQALGVLDGFLRKAMSAITRTPPERIDPEAPMKDLGFDSLMLVSLKNVLERELAIPISTATLYGHPTPKRLAAYILGKLAAPPANGHGNASGNGRNGHPPPAADEPAIPAAIEALTDNEAEAALRATLASLTETDDV